VSVADRDKLIVADRLAGMTYAKIGEKYDLTRERCKQICKRAYQRGEITQEQLRTNANFGMPYGYRTTESRIVQPALPLKDRIRRARALLREPL
jgi:hypothetical protein